MTPTLSRILVTLVIPLSFGGCGGHLLSYMQSHEKLNYTTQCQQKLDSHKGETLRGENFSPRLFAERWLGQAVSHVPKTEKEFIDAISEGQTKLSMVVARGGLGKTRLAHSINAQTCSALPVFTIDLNKDIAQRKSKTVGNPFVDKISEILGLGIGSSGLVRTDELLKTHPWVLLADAIEEVDLNQRARVSLYLAKLRKAYGGTMRVVIFARPPVLEAYYGFGDVDTLVKINVIDCKRAHNFLKSISKSKAQEKSIWTFAKKFNFDVVSRSGNRCVYPYLSSYRDIQTLRALALSKEGSLKSHADAHQRLVAMRLKKELAVLSWNEREVLDMVDRMFRRFLETSDSDLPRFDIVNCMKSIDPQYGWTAVDAGLAGTPEQRRRQVCEKALQSVVFEKDNELDGEAGRWRLSDADMVALFRARWINNKLAALPTNACAELPKYKRHLLNRSVLHYVVAEPMTQHCLGPTLRMLCEGDRKAPRHLETVIEGLPIGQMRFQVVEEARAFEAEKGPNACVIGGLDAIAQTISR
ncbi:MAG TPA: hypothetical protein DCQ06_02815 [Myxococcales bacterium]|nr:hypothetical protein [Myxococcales bacterium]HAN30506.1 hypothetical protein [Myxococcales bacterium]